MSERAEERRLMVERQIARRGVRDPLVLAAMREVPREEFVGERWRDAAYEDGPLPIGSGQTISQPYIVALMIEAAGLNAGSRVLEVGAGSGYAAAVMGRIARKVWAIERHETLAREAAARIARLGYDNVVIRAGDGSLGLPAEAPFDAILVAAAAPAMPAVLRDQLVIGGKLVAPVGGAGGQRLVKITRTGETSFAEEDLGGVMFVPLIGGG